MTAPPRVRAKPTTSPPRRGVRPGREPGNDRESTRGTGTGSRSSAAERAYARRAARAEQAKRAAPGAAGSGERSQRSLRSRLRLPRSRTSFVLIIMAMLAAGVVATLWLSTQAIAGSYKLERLHKTNGELTERVSQLERVVTKRESAPWLAEHARELGMVPGPMPAKLAVHSDGSVTVVGEPHKAHDSSPESSDPPDDSEQESTGDDGGQSGEADVPADEEG